MLRHHREAILNSIHAHQPNLANTWAVNVCGEILAQEGKKLANYLYPSKGTLVSDVLENFTLERILSEAEQIASMLCQILCLVSTSPKSDGTDNEIHLDGNLICLSYKFYLLTIIYLGSRYCHMYACADLECTFKQVSNHHVHIST